MTQNIYDNPAFFARYSQLPRSLHGLDGAPEWPTLRTMLPDPRGRRVLDLGCGFGWFCRWARQVGAAAVLGLDVSENMLARARAEPPNPGITYQAADLETLLLPPDRFDLAYSSLALHYLRHADRLLAQLHRALVPGGALVFSVEHPINTAAAHADWVVDAKGRRSWPVNGYLDEGERVTDWLAKGVIKQHRSMATWLNLLLGAGFALTRIEDWAPSAEQIAAHPDWAGERERPLFLLVAARR